jgi:hypothetical protein
VPLAKYYRLEEEFDHKLKATRKPLARMTVHRDILHETVAIAREKRGSSQGAGGNGYRIKEHSLEALQNIDPDHIGRESECGNSSVILKSNCLAAAQATRPTTDSALPKAALICPGRWLPSFGHI